MSTRYLSPEREAKFPNLKRADYEVSSDEDWAYNCIAHAVGEKGLPWWPVENDTEGVFWPDGVPREETVAAFVAAFRTRQYVPCNGPEPEDGFEKIALYMGEDGTPTHAARQLPASGIWTIKLGDWEDIEHKALTSLESELKDNPAYGKA